MKPLTREEILHAEDIKRETVKVPEWGGEVLVTTMTGRERDALEIQTFMTNTKDKARNLENFRARLCAQCMVDEDGQRIFSDADVAALGNKSASALSRVYDAAEKLNHVTKADVEELAKNSAGGPSDEPGTDSPAA